MAAKKKKKKTSYRGLYLILLILFAGFIAAGVFSKSRKTRGEKRQGESCVTHQECASGFLCMSYQDTPRQCHQTCYRKNCPPDLRCVSIGEAKGRRSTRVRNICVRRIVEN